MNTVSNLLEDCRDLGTIPFSILARHAFIATSFLRSLVRRNVLSESEALNFKQSIKTVASELVQSLDQVSAGRMSIEKCMERFGHLRPGTYDILSLRYDQRTELFSKLIQKPITVSTEDSFIFSPKQEKQIQKLCNEFGFEIDPFDFIDYLKKATIAREYAKFEFSKNISEVLEIIAAWGEDTGLNRDQLSYLPINEILDAGVVAEGPSVEKHLQRISKENREQHKPE